MTIEPPVISQDTIDTINKIGQSIIQAFAAMQAAATIAARQWQALAVAFDARHWSPTPHDYAAARVQLRREGIWAPGDPAPVDAIEERARLLALMAWARNRGA